MEDNITKSSSETMNCGVLMDAEGKRLFKVRKVQKAKKPQFKRTDCHKYKRLDSNWRIPRGQQSKKRKGFVAKGAHAQVGYGSPVLVKGLHPSGYSEVIVSTLNDVSPLDANTMAIRIAATVGARKKAMIEEKAVSMGIKILNPSRSE
ncbi:50S ribosomal protein L32e [uncultured Methanomethylovorans sp.]|uniref:50S ribosomal protein L32e n=1 Tax=uncultured Methanomethylovorans sp. TaxID=183759 RepID=UPI002AA639E3|nr:50S ribosomal protein L32e [uncultured Methanomethylovorans sp.]